MTKRSGSAFISTEPTTRPWPSSRGALSATKDLSSICPFHTLTVPVVTPCTLLLHFDKSRAIFL